MDYVTYVGVCRQLVGSRYGESQRAYREVQERHEEIKRIEQTLAELAQLFNDVGVYFFIAFPLHLTRIADECNG
jgi:hypothetical protein